MMQNHSLNQALRALAVVAAGLASSAPSKAQTRGPATLADSMALAITIYSVAFTNGTNTAHAATLPELVCVQGSRSDVDPPRAVLDALQKDQSLLVRPISACKTEPLRGATSGISLVVDTLTGKRGISVSAGEPRFEADGSFTVETGYYQHGRSGAGWLCKGQRQSDQGWEITSCTMQWIS